MENEKVKKERKLVAIVDKLLSSILTNNRRTPCNDGPEALAYYLNADLETVKEYLQIRENLNKTT